MSDNDALLQALLDAPDDDAPRLVYADWLEEHGEPERAEFIRVQIELANGLTTESRRDDLEAREQALLAEHEPAWVGPLAGWVGGWQFRRGFVEAVRVGLEALAGRAADLFATAPVRQVQLVGPRDGPLTPDVARPLAAAPQLARLTALDCSQVPLTAEGVAVLLACPHLAPCARSTSATRTGWRGPRSAPRWYGPWRQGLTCVA
jgi:uncharacterized protein (TIGR02996 family)